MNNLTKELFTYIANALKNGLTLEEITKDIIKNAEEFLDNTFDLSDLIDIAKFVINLSQAQEPKTNLEKQIAFENTLKAYEIDNSCLYNELIKLSKFDKISYQNGEPILAKLDLFLSIMLEHTEMIFTFRNIKENLEQKELSLICSKSEKNEELINPKIKTLTKAYNLTHSSDLIDSIKIYKVFKENPLEMDMVLSCISNFSDDKIKDHKIININAIKQARTYLECNDINFDDDKIIESLAIYLFSIYRKDSFINKILNIKKELSRSRVAEIANIILSNISEDLDFNYKHTHVVKPIQQYSYFANFQTPILEFRNFKNYKEHPFLEKNVDNELLSFFKSK